MPTAPRPFKYLDLSFYSSLERESSITALYLLKQTHTFISMPTRAPIHRRRYEFIASMNCTETPKLSLCIAPGSIEEEHSIVPRSRL